MDKWAHFVRRLETVQWVRTQCRVLAFIELYHQEEARDEQLDILEDFILRVTHRISNTFASLRAREIRN